MIKEKINSKKGITLVSLVISIIILLILSTISIYGIRSSNNISPYNNMIADINLLEDKILVYYNKYSEIPKTSEEIEIIFNKIKCKRLSLKAKFDIIKMERRKKRLKRKYEKNKKPKESTS